MTLTINDTCESITIDSIYFNDDAGALTLTVTHNCTTVYDDIDIDVNVDSFEITPEVLGLTTDTLEDGIYTLTLTVVTSDSEIVTEQRCAFVNCTIKCNMLDTFTSITSSSKDDIVKALAYYALTVSDGCTSCACSDLCDLYNTATETDCDDASPCGCS